MPDIKPPLSKRDFQPVYNLHDLRQESRVGSGTSSEIGVKDRRERCTIQIKSTRIPPYLVVNG